MSSSKNDFPGVITVQRLPALREMWGIIGTTGKTLDVKDTAKEAVDAAREFARIQGVSYTDRGEQYE
jgi:hypothetical protein